MKIDIIGSVASGKTTLARKLSRQYQIPYYEKDNIVWKRTPSGDVRRSDEERDRLFQEILSQDCWIVEGSPRKCLTESFAACDILLLLDVPVWLRLYRVFRRWIRQRRNLESYNSQPTWNFLILNLHWVMEFTVQRKRLIQDLSRYGDKLKIFKSAAAAEKFLEATQLHRAANGNGKSGS